MKEKMKMKMEMENYIPLVTKNCARKILLGEIIYIMKKNRKIKIVTEKECYEFYERMEPVKDALDKRFYGCMRNFFINMDKVERMENQTIYFCNGDRLSMGRDNFIRTRQHYSAYLKKLL